MGRTAFVDKEVVGVSTRSSKGSTHSKTPSELECGTHGEQQKSANGASGAGGEEWKPGKQEYAIMLTIAIVSLMVALDATILVPVLPALALDLNGSATDAFWAGTSYLLTCAVFQPFIAAASDIFGRKEMLLASILFFTLGNALCAPVAKDFTVLFAGRTLQGIGGGGIITMGQVIYADIIPLRQRPKYFAIVLGSWALGSVLGPLLGGLFVQHLSWRWCFYVNFPFCALGFVLVPLFVKLKTEKSTLLSKLRRIDWVGAFFFIGGMTSFLIGLSWAGIQYDWSSVQVIIPMIAGLSAVVAALVWELYGATEPMIRPSLFHSPSALAAYACAFCQGFLLFCALYYVPSYFMAVQFTTPTQSGLNIFPVTCLLLPGSIVVSFLTSRLGRFRWAVWMGWMITATGCGLLVLFDQGTSTVEWAGILCVFGVGNGMVLTSVNVAIQAISHVEDCGRAASMYAFMRTMGMTIGVAVGGTTFQNVMSNRLDELNLPESIAHNAEAFVEKLVQMPVDDPVRVGALLAYVQGYHGVFWVMTGTACFGFLVSLIIKRHSMDKILESKFTLDGGNVGATLREKADQAEKRLTMIQKRASQMLMPTPDAALARLSRYSAIGGSFFIEAHDDKEPMPGTPTKQQQQQQQQQRKSFYSPMKTRSRESLDSNSDMIPLRTASATHLSPIMFTNPTFSGSTVTLNNQTQNIRPPTRTVTGPFPVPSGSKRSSLTQAPAVAFYIAPGNRRVPIEIPTERPDVMVAESVHLHSHLSLPKTAKLTPSKSIKSMEAKPNRISKISYISKRDGF